jgi:hypothetical protein
MEADGPTWRNAIFRLIMPGRVPGIVFRSAKQDRRDKPGDDELFTLSLSFQVWGCLTTAACGRRFRPCR